MNALLTRRRLALALAVAFVAGCAGRPSVSGTVKARGKEATGGELIFSPVGHGKSATASINKDGTFTVPPRLGAGRFKVTYQPPVIDAGRELKEGESPPPSGYEGLVPRPDEVELVSGSNVLSFELVPGRGKKD